MQLNTVIQWNTVVQWNTVNAVVHHYSVDHRYTIEHRYTVEHRYTEFLWNQNDYFIKNPSASITLKLRGKWLGKIITLLYEILVLTDSYVILEKSKLISSKTTLKLFGRMFKGFRDNLPGQNVPGGTYTKRKHISLLKIHGNLRKKKTWFFVKNTWKKVVRRYAWFNV